MSSDSTGGDPRGGDRRNDDQTAGERTDAVTPEAPSRRMWILWSVWRTALIVAALVLVLVSDGWRRSVWIAVLAVLLATTWVFRPSRMRRAYSPPAALREPGDFRVVLQVTGDRPGRVMHEIHRITGADVARARGLASSAPVVVVENLSQESAAQAAHLLQAAGARAVATPMDRAS